MLVRTAIFLLSILVTSSMFFDFKKRLRLRFKIFFLIVIIIGNVALLCESKDKERTEYERWANSQWREDMRTQGISGAIKDLKEKKQSNILTDDYHETAQGFLDMNYSRLKDLFGTNKKINKHYLTIYFTEVSKIPNFYNWGEWRETESLLFDNMRNSLQGYFINRGRSEHGKTVVAEFTKEREKYIKAKEREYKEKNSSN